VPNVSLATEIVDLQRLRDINFESEKKTKYFSLLSILFFAKYPLSEPNIFEIFELSALVL